MSDLMLIKLGGSVLTDKNRPESLNVATLGAVAQQLAQVVRDQPRLRLIIGHGGGSFGHHWAQQYGTQHGISDARGWEGFARVQDAMGRLNRTVVATLLEAGMKAVGVAPSAGVLASAGVITSWELRTLEAMLEHGLVPIVHGDVVLDQEQGAAIVSTEGVFSYLVPRLHVRQIVLIGEAGVWTADPHRDRTATRIPRIDGQNIASVLRQTAGSHGVDVTGGMASKVALMWRLVQQQPGLTVQLVGPGELAAAFELPGSVGTLMQA